MTVVDLNMMLISSGMVCRRGFLYCDVGIQFRGGSIFSHKGMVRVC